MSREDLTTSGDYDIRYSTTADEKGMNEWFKDPLVAKWYPPSEENDRTSFIRNWVGFSKYKASITATFKGEPIGVATVFLMPYIKVAHISMMYMVVDPKYQRRGVGRSLVKNVKHLARSRFRLESMHCEVYENAPIIGLLESSGFEAIITQDHFVKLPGEGYQKRYIMETHL